MPTRFYLEPTIAAAVSPSFDAGWEQNGQAVRRKMRFKNFVSVATALTNSTAVTVPITTTQDILCYQFVSDPLPSIRLAGTINFVIRALENASTNNVTLAVLLKYCSWDGGTVRGTIFSTFNTDVEFATSLATRFVGAQALTATTLLPGDRLILEVGGHAAGPTAAGSFTMNAGFNAAADLAYSSGVATANNPSMELSQDLFAMNFNDYQSARADDGISVSERVR